MNQQVLLLISGVAFLVFLFLALDLSRLLRKKSGEWRKLAAEAQDETSPLMEVEQDDVSREGAAATAGEGETLHLPKAPEIIDSILTHTDWDGIVSGALIKHFSPLARVMVTTPMALRHSLRDLAKSPDKPNRLFISDLGIKSDHLPGIEGALIDLSQAGTKIYWYDHHPWSPLSVETAGHDCADLIVDPKSRNAAEIIQKRLVPDDKYSQKLIRLLNNHSTPEEKDWAENWRRLILATTSSGTFSEIVDLIGHLGANSSLSMSDKFKISRIADEEKIFEKFARGKHREETTASGLKFLVVDLRTYRMEYDKDGAQKRKFDRHTPPAGIGHDIVKYHNPDFYIMVLKNDRLSIRSGRGNKFKADALQDIRSIKGNPVQVSGHAYAAGVYLSLSAKSKLRSIWDWNLPPEAEDFIAEVKNRL